MPLEQNPDRDWLASANHRIIPADYPYDYSTFFAHSWRYRRIVEQMNALDTWATSDHWKLQLDTKNMFAEKLVPLMVPVLLSVESTKQAGGILQSWDLMDEADQPAPLIYQSILRHYARHVVADELGEELSGKYLNDYYYWHERIAQITLQPGSEWLDDKNTEAVESREDLFARAAQDMLEELVPEHGVDMSQWRWGDEHTITFFHPLIPGDFAAQWIGGGSHGISGSGETLNRAAYQYNSPYRTTFFDSMRLVMDLSDPDKIEVHIPGGVSERLFNKQMTSDLDNWLSGTPNYWWFSDRAIADNAVSEMMLNP